MYYPDLAPDLNTAKTFLKILTGKENCPVTFQVFDDVKTAGHVVRNKLAKNFFGTLENLGPKLIELNKKACGVFVTINETDGEGRKDNNIISLRSLFADDDRNNLPTLKVEPSILIQARAGLQPYFILLPGEPLDRFTPAQKALVAHLGTDGSVCDLSRVMRIPGFYNMKDPANPFLVKIKSSSDKKYTIDKILEFYPATAEKQTQEQPSATHWMTEYEGDLSTLDIVGLFKDSDLYFDRINEVKHSVNCPWRSEHTSDSDGTSTTAIFEAQNGPPGFKCFHSHCANKSLQKVLEYFGKVKVEEFCKEKFKRNASKFVCNDKGVFWIGGNEQEPTLQRICSKLEVLAHTRDQDNESWSALLAFKDREKYNHELSLPFSAFAGDGGEYRAALLDHGLEIETSRGSKEKLASYIQKAKPVHGIKRCSPKVGWYGQSYVLPDMSFSPHKNSDRIFLKASNNTEAIAKTSGTLEEWQTHIAALCLGNSRLVFAISAALTGPLLGPTNEQGAGFNYFGNSSIGKTTALKVAGSVCGGGGLRGYIDSWRSTTNALEAVAAKHCDTLLILDELGQLDPKEAGNCAYMLINGIGKGRLQKDITTRKTLEWRTILLSSSEPTFAQFVQESGKEIKAGQEVRVVDILGDAGRGLGLFENLHGVISANEFSLKLEEATNLYYGTPLRSFLSRFVPRVDSLSTTIQDYRIKFMTEQFHQTEKISSQIQRVMRKFSLVAAAGEVGISLGILPWPPGEALKAASSCFQGWLENRGGKQDSELMTGILKIRKFLQVHGLSRFALLNNGGMATDHKIPSLAGFRIVDEDKEQAHWLIFTAVFKEEVCKGLSLKAIKIELSKRGYLIHKDDGKYSIVERLPELGPTRVYKICSSILLDETDITESTSDTPPRSNFTGASNGF